MSRISNDGLTRYFTRWFTHSCTHMATVSVKGLNMRVCVCVCVWLHYIDIESTGKFSSTAHHQLFGCSCDEETENAVDREWTVESQSPDQTVTSRRITEMTDATINQLILRRRRRRTSVHTNGHHQR